MAPVLPCAGKAKLGEARQLADQIWSAGTFANEVARAIVHVLDEDEEDEGD